MNTYNAFANIQELELGFSPYPSYVLNYPCQSSTQCTVYQAYLPRGDYLFELWGASGGNCTQSYSGGMGGYSITPVSFSSSTWIFIDLGGRGMDRNANYAVSGGHNGGGGVGQASVYGGASGGGYSAIKVGMNINSGIILVAGGGGGAGIYGHGGNGGGLIGAPSINNSNGYSFGGLGGTQTEGGYSNSNCMKASSGSFLQGGDGSSSSTIYGCGGGGGGYYGGGGGWTPYNNAGYGGSGGGGGSGFSLIKHSNEFSRFIPGTDTSGKMFPNPYGGYTTGFYGHGVARITIIGDPYNNFDNIPTQQIIFSIIPQLSMILSSLFFTSILN